MATRSLLLATASAIALAGCAGRAPQPVETVQLNVRASALLLGGTRAWSRATNTRRSEQPLRWLLGLARASLGWVVISLSVLLPLQRLVDAGGEAHAFLASIVAMLIAIGCGIMWWAADAVRDRG